MRILLVEDEGLVALLLEDMIEDLGCELVASASRVAQAFDALARVAFDFAVLDVNVAGETSYDFARTLLKRQIPFVFSTGYGRGSLPEDLAGATVLTKPFATRDLQRAMMLAKT